MTLLNRVLSLDLSFNILTLNIACFLAVVSSVLPMSLPFLFGIVIDSVLASTPLSEIMMLVFAMTLVTIVTALASVGSNKTSIGLGYSLSQQLSLKLYSSVLRMPYLTYSTVNQGVLVSRLTNDMRMIEPLFVEVPHAAIRGWSALAASALALAYVNAWFLAAFLVVPLSLVMVRFAESKINDSIKKSFELSARVSEQIEKTTSGDAIGLIRQSGSTLEEVGSYDKLSMAVADLAARLDFWRANVRTAYDTSFGLISLVILGVGVVLITHGYSTVGGVVSALLYIGLLRQPLSELVGLRYLILRASIGLKRVEDVLKSPNTGLDTISPSLSTGNAPAQARDPEDDEGAKPAIEFNNVWFKYPSLSEISVEGLSQVESAHSSVGFAGSVSITSLARRDGEPETRNDNAVWALQDISFSVRKGEAVAITGVSGSGKSTIVALACGLLRPTKGGIFLSGADTKDLIEEEIWRDISLVSQDIYLREASLRDNLNYGAKLIPDHELLEACSLAGLGELISSLPSGLDTQVGTRGKRFSGGERQRISIARAILKNSKILILDEATSQLDSEKEADILSAIKSLRADKAVLVIAHRLAAISQNDSIMVIEAGQIIESGTHERLSASSGRYSELHFLDQSEGK